MRVQFHGLRFELPFGWTDITDDVEGSLPTLGRPAGCGAIQFSKAVYRSGDLPHFTENNLRELTASFCVRHSLDPSNIEELDGEMTIVGCVSSTRGELIGTWHLSNGSDLILVTYTSRHPSSPQTESELQDARAIVTSMEI